MSAPAHLSATPPREKATIAALLGRMTAERPANGRVSLDQLMQRAGRRGPAFLLLFLTLLSMIFSIVPGFSTLVGLPILLICAQMALGRRKLGLPGWLGRRTLDYDTLLAGLDRRLDYVRRFERLLRPRLKFFCSRGFIPVIGFTGIVSAIVLSLPLPLMNFPPTFAVFLMSLGLLGKDGAVVLLGFLVALAIVLGLAAVAVVAPQLLAELWALLGL